MAPPTFDICDISQGPPTLARARLRSRRRDVRYRLVVVSHSAADAARSAGGWLFDRALAGCEVTAVIPDRPNNRALRILGVETVDLDSALASDPRTIWPDTLAVAGHLYRRDPRVRQAVLDAVNAGMTNVLMWGNSWPGELDGLVSSVEHRLSIAARAFKAHALAAAGAAAEAVEPTEAFRGVDLRSCRTEASKLGTAS